MAKETDAPVIPERATRATTRPATVPLNEFVLRPELFCHRKPEELQDRERLQPLMASLTVEGQQAPVEFYRGPDGQAVATKGHRRISAMRQLAKENTPNFTLTMPVEAVEVLGASEQDLVVRSVSDNTNRKDYTVGERIRGAKTMHDRGVEANRAAYALGYSTKQYLRDLRLAQHDWMLAHVERGDIGHTAAGDLLAAADKAGRIPELKDHLGVWIEETKKRLRHKRVRERMAGGKEVTAKAELTNELADHWAGLLARKLPLDDALAAAEEPEVAIAGIDADANKVIFNEAEIDLMKISVPDLAKAVATVGGVQKVMVEYLRKRHAVEGARPAGPRAAGEWATRRVRAGLVGSRRPGQNLEHASRVAGAREPDGKEARQGQETQEVRPLRPGGAASGAGAFPPQK